MCATQSANSRRAVGRRLWSGEREGPSFSARFESQTVRRTLRRLWHCRVCSRHPEVSSSSQDLACAAKAPNEKAKYGNQTNRRQNTNDEPRMMRQTDFGGDVFCEIGRAKHRLRWMRRLACQPCNCGMSPEHGRIRRLATTREASPSRKVELALVLIHQRKPDQA